MRVRHLYRETVVSSPVEKVFAFFSDPDNLLQVTPDTFPTRILNEEPIVMEKGAVIRLKMRLFRIFPVRWETEIVIWDPPHQFVDVQPTGPYRYWKHTHTFEAVGDHTRIVDQVEYGVPGWFFEPLIHFLVVKKSLNDLFDYRQQKYLEYLGAP